MPDRDHTSHVDGRQPVTPAPTQAALGAVLAGVIRNAINPDVQPDDTGVIAPFSFKPPGGNFGWKRVRIANYTPYVFEVVGVPHGSSGDGPQLIQPYQQNVWNYDASSGSIVLRSPSEALGSPLAEPPNRFAYGAGTAKDALLSNYVSVEWTDTPDLFFGYYPVPLVGIAITAETMQTSPIPLLIALPAGAEPVAAVVDDVRNRVYVANHGNDTVTVIDGQTSQIIATIPVGVDPTDITFDIATNKAYVANNGATTVTVIDGHLLAAIGTIPLGAGANPVGITANPITGDKYVTTALNTVIPIDATETPGVPIAVGTTPKGIAVDTTTNQVYVANSVDNTVTQINGNTNLVVGAPIPVGNAPLDITTDSQRNLIFTANSAGNSVSVIDGATATVTHTIVVGNNPIGIDADAVSAKVYVANNASNTISVIDSIGNVIVATFNPGIGPKDVVANSVTNRIYIPITADAVVVLQGAP